MHGVSPAMACKIAHLHAGPCPNKLAPGSLTVSGGCVSSAGGRHAPRRCVLRQLCGQVYARADVEAAGAAMHVPRVEMGSRAKLSCVAWNSYVKGALLAADYDGGVALWDAEAAACTALFEEHSKRVWSVDFSQVGPILPCLGARRQEGGAALEGSSAWLRLSSP